jgi:endonuclease/exonuclease/phosphatase family metal-dependent hydrolase
MGKVRSFRAVTYNIHKCRGMDRRVRPERIVDVLREIDADIVALQEVLWIHGAEDRDDHAHFMRGCLRVDIDLPGKQSVHVYNVHLGTSYSERHHQARKLLNQEILKNGDHAGPRLLLGDFNDWTRGPASRLLAEHFRSADIRIHIGRFATYPGFLPLVHLDHIYYDESLELMKALLHRSRTALVASDHLPMVADFRF